MSGSCWHCGTYGDFQIEKNVDFIEQLVSRRVAKEQLNLENKSKPDR